MASNSDSFVFVGQPPYPTGRSDPEEYAWFKKASQFFERRRLIAEVTFLNSGDQVITPFRLGISVAPEASNIVKVHTFLWSGSAKRASANWTSKWVTGTNPGSYTLNKGLFYGLSGGNSGRRLELRARPDTSNGYYATQVHYIYIGSADITLDIIGPYGTFTTATMEFR